jgi:peptidoglycan/LPS O-acetylase OafA/YrhL
MARASHDGDRFVLLDGMRGAAALVVITDHVPSDFFMGLLPGRYLAVDFFFALSGFVLAHVYGARLASGMSALDFMRVRLIRFYPLYIFATLAGAALAFAYTWKGWNEASFTQDLASLGFGAAFLPTPPGLSVHPNEPFPFNGPAWSLFFELAINAVFAIIALRLSNRVLGTILLVSGAALVLTGFYFGRLDGGFQWSNFFAGATRVSYAFFAGVLVYRLRSYWRVPALPPALAFAALIAIFRVPAQGEWRAVFDLIAALFLFPLLIAFSADARPRGAFLTTCATMGALSYGFYVLQVPVRDWISVVSGLYFPAFQQLPGAASVILIAAATAVAAAILNAVYDIPVRRFLTRRHVRAAQITAAE